MSGHLPIQSVLSKDASSIYYKAWSTATLYAIVIYVLLFLVQFVNFQFSTVNSHFTKLIHALFLSMLIRSLFSFGFSLHHHAKHIPRLIKLLDAFDRQRDVVVIRPRHSKMFYILCGIVLPSVLTVSLAGVYLKESSDLVQQISIINERNSWYSFFFGVCSVWHFLPPTCFIYIATKISSGFNQINRTIIAKRYCVSFFQDKGKFDSDMGENIGKLRLLHNLLSEATHCLSRCYGNFMAVNSLFLIVAVVVNISVYWCAVRDFNLITLVCVDCLYFFVTAALGTIVTKRVSKAGPSIYTISCVLSNMEKILLQGVKVTRLFQGIPTSALSEKSKEEVSELPLTLLCVVLKSL